MAWADWGTPSTQFDSTMTKFMPSVMRSLGHSLETSSSTWSTSSGTMSPPSWLVLALETLGNWRADWLNGDGLEDLVA
jgi:hypothetical protein